MKSSFLRRLFCCILCVCVTLCFSSCDKDGDSEKVTLTFSEINVRGNSNGNIANMGLGVVQGEWIIFSDLSDGYLKATKDKGAHCLTLMESLNDMFACMNLIGQELDYISPLYGDINTVDLSDGSASSLIPSGSYCLQRVEGFLYYIDESGDGKVCRVNCETGQDESLSSHKAYIEGVTTESLHASFSIDNGYLYYAAADDNFSIYRINLSTKEETKLSSSKAAMLIVEEGHVVYKDGDDSKLYSLSENGEAKRLTDVKVGTFNFDGTYIYYTDLSSSRETVMKMRRSGNDASVFCDVSDTMYINLLDDIVMLYCISGNGEITRTVFVDSEGKYYIPE